MDQAGMSGMAQGQLGNGDAITWGANNPFAAMRSAARNRMDGSPVPSSGGLTDLIGGAGAREVYPQAYKDGSVINWNQPPAQGAVNSSRAQMPQQGLAGLMAGQAQPKPQEQTFKPNYSPAVMGKMDQTQIQGRSPVFAGVQNKGQLTPQQMATLGQYRPDLAADPMMYRGSESDYRSVVNRTNQMSAINDFFKNYKG